MSHQEEVNNYVRSILLREKIACKELILSCMRYENDLKDDAYIFRPEIADAFIDVIAETVKLLQGEDENGNAYRGNPFYMQPWQKFIMYNLFGFYYKSTSIRRFQEAMIYVPRKNGKTPFAASLAWAFALYGGATGARVLLTSRTLKQSLLSFEFIKENIELAGYPIKRSAKGLGLSIRDNNQNHSIKGDLYFGDSYVSNISIEAFSGSRSGQDGFQGNFVIADELHEYVDSSNYEVFQQATKAVRDKLVLGISTAGKNPEGFLTGHLKRCDEVLTGHRDDKGLFIFICKAEENEQGVIDILDPKEHERANPSYNVTISSADMLQKAYNVVDNPDQKLLFMAKELNIFPKMRSNTYFDMEVFINSDSSYDFSLEQLQEARLTWYGGVDLSRRHDLSALCVVTRYKGVLVIVPQAFTPITMTAEKVQKDGINIDLWIKQQHLTVCESPLIDIDDVVNYCMYLKEIGIFPVEYRYDRAFAKDFVTKMEGLGFVMRDQPQLYNLLTKAFLEILYAAIEKRLYFFHSAAFLYCTSNIKVIEKPNDKLQYMKVSTERRIDVFTGAVFAVNGLIEREAEEEAVKQKAEQKARLSKLETVLGR
jgi:phage terminase large subunit-like protein